jgi:hypothetical protein
MAASQPPVFLPVVLVAVVMVVTAGQACVALGKAAGTVIATM